MISFAAQKYRIVLRAAVFFGVFGALLFSCGEGIRLFPFPAASAATQKNASFVKSSRAENAYQKNLHRFENQPADLKNQNGNRHLSANKVAALKIAPHLTVAPTSAPALPFGFKNFSGVNSFAAAGSRAPPFS